MSKLASLFLYLLVYAASALILHGAARLKSKRARFWGAWIAIFIPCFFAGIRYGVGTDYFHYLSMYHSHVNLSLTEYFRYSNASDFSFYLITKFCGLFNSPQLMYFIFAFFTYAPVAKFILERNEKGTVFFLSFFFLLGSFSSGLNIMRQMAAASIIFYSMKYLLNRNLKKFLLGILIATLFHVSALIVLPTYYLWNNRKKFSIYSFRSWLIILLYAFVVFNMSSILQLLGGRFEGYSLGKSQGRNLSILLNAIWMVIFVFFHKYYTKRNPQDGLFVLMIIIGSILSFSGMLNVYVKRIAIYFNYCDFLLLVQLRHVFTKRSKPLFYMLATAYSIIIFILTFYILGQSEIIPYYWKI